MRQLVFAMEPGGSDANMTDVYSTLGFLYGTIPAAPTVFLFASYYQQSASIVSSNMALFSTIMSFINIHTYTVGCIT